MGKTQFWKLLFDQSWLQPHHKHTIEFSILENMYKHQRKLQNLNNIVKKIAGSDWGCTKETLSVT